MTKSKFNKSEIFKKAWSFVKELGMTLSNSLKLSWKEAKEEIKEAIINIKTEFDINGTLGVFFYNAIKGKFQVNIDLIDLEDSDIIKRFDTKEEMNAFLNNL